MEYQVAFSPELGLSLATFAMAWNNTPDCRAIAEARVGHATTTQYDPTLITGAVAVLGSVAVGLATNALYDLIKQTLVRQGVRKRTEIVQLEQPDGTRLLIVTTRED